MDHETIKNELEKLANEGLAGAGQAADAPGSGVQADESDAKSKQEGQPRQNGLIETDHAARGFHLDVRISPEQVVRAAEILDRGGFTLETITGVDWLKENQFELVYDYACTGGKLFRAAVRTRIDRDKPEIATISEVFPGANWHERETWDFFGIIFTGHPQLERFLLPDDCDFHPLRKDFQP